MDRADPEIEEMMGLEHEGQPLLTPFSLPWYPTMKEAVLAVVERKFGEQGIFRGDIEQGVWKEPQAIAATAQPPSRRAIEATVAYCEYVQRRYGRFPAYAPPFRTVAGYQVGHVDLDFYDRFYRAEALSETQRRHLEDWHGGGSN